MRSKIVISFFSLLIFCLSAVFAAPKIQSDIDYYLGLSRSVYKYAVITGWFSDWRSVSIYRSHAGYHYGYDIAMPAGTLAPAGWTGVVVDIIPWSASEWGIYVRVDGGYIVSYGHLKPIVKVGQRVLPGTPIGSVVVNHVDIKVRNSAGNFVDIGKTYGLLPVTGTLFCISTVNSVNLSDLIKSKKGELLHLEENLPIISSYMQLLKSEFSSAKENVKKLERLYSEELVSQKECQEARKQLKSKQDDFKRVQNEYREHQTRISKLKKELAQMQVKKIPKASPSKIQKSSNEMQLLEKKKAEVEKYRLLYEEGAISKKQLDQMISEYQRMKIEIKYKHI